MFSAIRFSSCTGWYSASFPTTESPLDIAVSKALKVCISMDNEVTAPSSLIIVFFLYPYLPPISIVTSAVR